MSRLKRMKQVLSANIDHLIEKAEDPEKMIKQLIREMNEHIVSVRMEVARAIASENRIARRVEEAQTSRGKHEERSRSAVADGDDDEARQHIAARQSAERDLDELDAQHAKAVMLSARMKEELRVLEDKIRGAMRRKDVLVAHKRRDEAQEAVLDSSQEFERISKHADTFLNGSAPETAMDTFDEAIPGMELEAESEHTVTETARDAKQQAQAVEDELCTLKKELGDTDEKA